MFKPILVVATASLLLATATTTNRGAEPNPRTVQEHVSLLRLPVYSSEGRQVGEVRQVRVGSKGEVEAIRIELTKSPEADAKTVEIPAAKFSQKPDRVIVAMTAAEVGQLPEVK
jgi:sporulation protein YlmC with PRC-barrel domain